MKKKTLLRTVPVAGVLIGLNLLAMGEMVRTTLPARAPARAADADSIARCVVLVLDGLDYGIVSEYFAADKLPNLRALRDEGAYYPLQSELPPESPVALTSIGTGVGPGKHGIFDFVVRDENYRPVNGMVDVTRVRLLGRVPVRPPRVVSRVRVPTFTDEVWQAGYPVLALRKPLGFPVKHQPGALITSGLGTPDLAGSAGLYMAYSSEFGFQPGETMFGGRRIPIHRVGLASDSDRPDRFETRLDGPPDPTLPRDSRGALSYASVPMVFERLPGKRVRITLQGQSQILDVDEDDVTRSEFFSVRFKVNTLPPVGVAGVVRLNVKSYEPLRVFSDPVNMDPHDPMLPISTPADYAGDLWDVYGPQENVGWPEQTFQRNDLWQTDRGFLKDLLQDVDRAAANLLGEMKRKAETRLVFSTITATDRACHCFFWTRDKFHPLYDAEAVAALGDPIGQVFERVDQVVGKVRASLGPNDTLLIASDHGFTTWRWGVNINQWLLEEGYMTLRDKVATKTLGTFFGDADDEGAVDWSKTKAFAIGLGQIYLNVEGRDAKGIVPPGEIKALREEIRTKLLALTNPYVETRADGGAEQDDTPKQPVRKVWFLHEEYSGPYAHLAPDIQVGFDRGYRVSWETALLGGMEPGGRVFERNTVPWSGDHCSCDPDVVRGVLFSNRPISPPPAGQPFHVRDIAPTVLKHFGLDSSHMDGSPLPLGR